MLLWSICLPCGFGSLCNPLYTYQWPCQFWNYVCCNHENWGLWHLAALLMFYVYRQGLKVCYLCEWKLPVLMDLILSCTFCRVLVGTSLQCGKGVRLNSGVRSNYPSPMTTPTTPLPWLNCYAIDIEDITSKFNPNVFLWLLCVL